MEPSYTKFNEIYSQENPLPYSKMRDPTLSQLPCPKGTTPKGVKTPTLCSTALAVAALNDKWLDFLKIGPMNQ